MNFTSHACRTFKIGKSFELLFIARKGKQYLDGCALFSILKLYCDLCTVRALLTLGGADSNVT